MTPRPYQSGERQRTVDAGRDRILQAALAVLKRADITAVSLEAVAQEAAERGARERDVLDDHDLRKEIEAQAECVPATPCA